MRILSLKTQGAVPFPDPVELTLPADRRKVAVAGDNGAGKTTLLDMVVGAIYGKMPNRPASLYDSFRGREALIDLTFEYGGRIIQIRRLIDADKRTQKSYLFVDGVPVTEGKADQFKDAVARVFPVTESAFLATVYHAQNGAGNPLGMSEPERRELITEILGLNEYDDKYMIAVIEANKSERDIIAVKSQRDVLTGQSVDLETLAKHYDLTQEGLRACEGTIADYERQHQDAMERLANAKANAQNLEPIKREIASLEAEINRLTVAAMGARAKIDKEQKEIGDQAEAIRAALAEQGEITARQGFNNERLAVLEKSIQAERDKHAAAVGEATQAFIASEAVLSEAQRNLATLQANTNTIQRSISETEARINSLTPQTQVLDGVPCKGTDLHAQCALLGQARQAVDTIEGLQGQLVELQTQRTNLDPETLQATNALAASESAKAHAKARLEEAQASQAVPVSLTQEHEGLKRIIATDTQRTAALKPLVDRAPYLDGHEDRMAQYRGELKAHQDRLAELAPTLERERQKLTDAGDLSSAITAIESEIAGIKTSSTTQKELHSNKLKALAQLETQIQTAKTNADKLASLNQDLATITKRQTVLDLLREGLGPKGARALRMDAAGPEIAELVNALIRECYGPRFTVTVQTLKQLKSSDEYREDLSFIIIDNETGEQTLVQNKSGGEQAIIKEAIALALAIYSRKNKGHDLRTLFRDECSAPLSEANTVAYMGMLDKACDLGGFDQVLYVSHKGAAQALADAVVSIERGRIRLIPQAA